jgi:hypothetical protein
VIRPGNSPPADAHHEAKHEDRIPTIPRNRHYDCGAHGSRKPSSASIATALLLSLSLSGCATGPISLGGVEFELPWNQAEEVKEVCAVDEALLAAEQAELFRQAETDRAKHLSSEIARLQTDLETAESALVEVESGIAGSNGRADAVSSLAVTRIQVERAASRGPWREVDIAGAREKLEEAERQVDEGRFGTALFFVYRARRVAEGVLAEATQVMEAGNARLIRAKRVNLRVGPATDETVLSVLHADTPVVPQAREGDWALVQVTGGAAGRLHVSFLGESLNEEGSAPAAKRP